MITNLLGNVRELSLILLRDTRTNLKQIINCENYKSHKRSWKRYYRLGGILDTFQITLLQSIFTGRQESLFPINSETLSSSFSSRLSQRSSTGGSQA